jgi:hypothetical protein
MPVHHPKIAVDRRDHARVASGKTNARRVIVLHSTEGSDRAGASDVDGVLKYLEGKGYGVHACIDGEGNVGRGAYDRQVVSHCKGANSISLGIEMIGFARWSTRDWLYAKLPTAKGAQARADRIVLRAQLLRVAHLMAYWSQQHDIPLMLSPVHGVARHSDFPAGGHWDPGPGFPIGYVLRHARRIKRMGQGQRNA